MKKILLSISLLALAYTASANVPVIKSDPKIEAQVEQTLKKLTLEEKIGQMMELVTDLFGANDKNGVFYIDEAVFNYLCLAFGTLSAFMFAYAANKVMKYND